MSICADCVIAGGRPAFGSPPEGALPPSPAATPPPYFAQEEVWGALL